MDCTGDDIRLYHILLDSSINGICFEVPRWIEKIEIDRLVQIGWCSIGKNGEIVLAYNEMDFSDLEKKFDQKCQKRAKERAEEELKKMQLAMDSKKQVKQNRRDQILTAVIAAIVTLIIEHFFEIVVWASDLWRSLFP